MQMEAFIVRTDALMPLIGIQDAAVPCLSADRAVLTVMTLDEKYKEVDALAEQCRELIGNYKQVYDIISKTAAPKANEKSEIDEKIKKYGEQCGSIQGELEALAKKTAFFEQQRAAYDREIANLNAMVCEIDKRNKSGNNFIPFYGIKYAVDTKNMYDDYLRKAKQSNVLRREVEKNHDEYYACLDRVRKLQNEKTELTMEMERLREKFGEVIELLNILNHMLMSLGNFIKAVGMRRNALQSSIFEDISEAQTAIERTFSMIRSFHDVFRKKLTEISGTLKGDTYNRVMNLTGG